MDTWVKAIIYRIFLLIPCSLKHLFLNFLNYQECHILAIYVQGKTLSLARKTSIDQNKKNSNTTALAYLSRGWIMLVLNISLSLYREVNFVEEGTNIKSIPISLKNKSQLVRNSWDIIHLKISLCCKGYPFTCHSKTETRTVMAEIETITEETDNISLFIDKNTKCQ